MEQKRTVHIISRASRLAQIQTEEVLRALQACHSLPVTADIRCVTSWGDRHKEISLLENPPADLFTRELDEALLRGETDMAVHSAKDLPFPLPEGIEVVALTAGLTGTDSLVSRDQQTLFQLPAGARIGTSSPARKQELVALRPDVEVVSIRGTIEERIAQVTSGVVDGLIVATCALQRLGLAHKASEILPFRTHPLQGHLAITARKGNEWVKAWCAPLDIRGNYGTVTLVGFGPGNPELLTYAGYKALEEADIIYFDDLTDPVFLERFTAIKRYVGKRSGHHSKEQAEINHLLLASAREGKKVVRLKGGDPMIFAHGGEEIAWLERHFIPVKVIPGITTASAMAACARISLTHRGMASSVAFVSGHHPDIAIPRADTLVFYMGAGRIREIAIRLVRKGWHKQTPVLLVHNVSRPDQQEFFTTLDRLQESTRSYPTPLIILVGEVVRQRKEAQAAPRPRKILHTGSLVSGYDTTDEVIHQPLIAIRPVTDQAPLLQVIHRLQEFDYLLFTSRYAVRYFFEALKQAKKR